MSIQNYSGLDPTTTFDIREVSTQNVGGVLIQDFTYLNPYQQRRAAFYIRPAESAAPMPVILYVHWYEPSEIDSNRTQFLDEAQEMAKRGAACLLVETMWSDRDWFIKRSQEEDLENSRRQVRELRQALDLLLSRPGVDADNLAFVGHDFGAMYGVVMGAADPRPKGYILMAGTPRFPDWYLYYPNLEGGPRQNFIDSFRGIDPITQVSTLSPAPVLFQFGTEDPHVPAGRAEEFFTAAADPKQIRWYQAGHGLNQDASYHRIAWLSELLQLK